MPDLGAIDRLLLLDSLLSQPCPTLTHPHTPNYPQSRIPAFLPFGNEASVCVSNMNNRNSLNKNWNNLNNLDNQKICMLDYSDYCLQL